MPEVGKGLFLGNEPITLIQNNGFVAIDPQFVSEFDPDAQAFFTATGITDSTIQDAVNTLVLDFKASGVWDKLVAFYPFVGGTATTHKYNLVDPRDLDAAYRLTFAGTWTHNSSGATPNGASGTYADTHLNAQASPLSVTNGHIYYYCPVSDAGAERVDVGAGNYTTGGESTMPTYWTNARTYYIWYNSNVRPGVITGAQGIGSNAHFIVNKIGSTLNAWRNGTKVGTGTPTAGGTNESRTFYLGAENNGTTSYRNSNRRHASTSIGEGLTDGEAVDMYDAINTFNTTLSR